MLAFVVGAEGCRRGARAADGVKLVDEDDAGGRLLGFGEEVANARRAHPDDGFDELRGGEAEEWPARLARHRPGEERLAGARRADQEDAVRDLRAKPLILFRCLEKVHDLGQVLLGLVDPGNVGKGRLRSRVGSVELRPALAKGAQNATWARGLHPPAQVEKAADQQESGSKADQQGEERRLTSWRRRRDRDVVLLQQRLQVVLGKDGPFCLEGCPAGGTVGHGTLEIALDRVSLGGDVLDVVGIHLLDEGCVGDRETRGPVCEQNADQVVEEE